LLEWAQPVYAAILKSERPEPARRRTTAVSRTTASGATRAPRDPDVGPDPCPRAYPRPVRRARARAEVDVPAEVALLDLDAEECATARFRITPDHFGFYHRTTTYRVDPGAEVTGHRGK